MSDLQTITKLKDLTGAGVMDCKSALAEANNDLEKAIEILRKKGEAKAAKKVAERTAKEGLVAVYKHSNNKMAAMVEIFCETDFVAKTEDFRNLANDVAMQIAAMNPQYLNPDQIPAEIIAKEKEIYAEQLRAEGKPEAMLEKIMEGKLQKFYEEVCLNEQTFIKDETLKVKQLIQNIIVKTGEKVEIGKFALLKI